MNVTQREIRNKHMRTVAIGAAAILALAALFAASLFAPIHAHAALKAPAPPKVLSVESPAAKTVIIRISKVKKATGYYFAVARDKNFNKGAKLKRSKSRTFIFKGLQPGKKYYVGAVSYVKKGKKTKYSNDSNIKTIKVKKKTPSVAKSLFAGAWRVTKWVYSDGRTQTAEDVGEFILDLQTNGKANVVHDGDVTAFRWAETSKGCVVYASGDDLMEVTTKNGKLIGNYSDNKAYFSPVEYEKAQ